METTCRENGDTCSLRSARVPLCLLVTREKKGDGIQVDTVVLRSSNLISTCQRLSLSQNSRTRSYQAMAGTSGTTRSCLHGTCLWKNGKWWVGFVGEVLMLCDRPQPQEENEGERNHCAPHPGHPPLVNLGDLLADCVKGERQL